MIKTVLLSGWSFLLKVMPRKYRVKLCYFKNFRRWPNINNPTTFNEKVLKRVLEEREPIYGRLADKLAVRDYVIDKVGMAYLIPLIHSSEDPDSILLVHDWSGIVIKPNHAAGMIEIFDSNPSMDAKYNIVKKVRNWLSIDFSNESDEWHYSLIKPKVLVERKITSNNLIPRDYKFHCFSHGGDEINYVLQLVDGRFGNESRGYYLNSLDNLVWCHGVGNHMLTEQEKIILHQIIDLNAKLFERSWRYVRIDWYIVDGQAFFGEMTFTPGAGRSNEFGVDLESKMFDFWGR